MKKKLILAAAVGMAMTSCVNESENLVSQQKSENYISFSTPVVAKNTRAQENEATRTELSELSLAYVTGKMDKYNTSQPFNVFGLYEEGKKKGNVNYYIDNATFTYQDGKWGSTTNYAWPAKGSLTFAAYSPASVKNVSFEVGTKFTISNFEVPAKPEDQFDLMYTEPVIRDCSQEHSSVNLAFKHALSCISVKLNVQCKDFAEQSTTNAYVKSVALKNIQNKGNFAWSKNAYVWLPDDTFADYTHVYEQDDYGKEASTFENETPLNELLLLPQDRTYGSVQKIVPEQDAHLEIVWYLKGDTEPVKQVTLVDLSTVKKDFLGLEFTERDHMEWKMGYCYTYNVTLNIDRLDVAVSLEENPWKTSESDKLNK